MVVPALHVVQPEWDHVPSILVLIDNAGDPSSQRQPHDAAMWVGLLGNESVPIQLTQCWFPGLTISNAGMYFFNKIHGSKHHQTSLGNCCGMKNTKMLIAVKK